ncbi:MAG TPA: FAD-dependent oxidoreductase [Nevskiaceae bacterium]|nr:FAD-dependent oxidoreductase [Nevskiaceae bacterium]
MSAAPAPLRVAVLGSGPSGLYAAAELLKRDATARVDLFDRLPTPGGLVRSGVSPDHAARRQVTSVYERIIASSGRFRFFGNVDVGRATTLDELGARYHAVVHATGAASDRRLGIPGDDLAGSHAATAFVGWYNGHPDFADCSFDLSCERAVVIGNGNVALDVARMLLLPHERLRTTDVADHALTALQASRVREVVILGRRGPAQAAFTLPELLELGELPDLDLVIDGPAALLADETPSSHPLRVRTLREFAARAPLGHARRIVFRFLASPVAIEGEGRVASLVVTRNELRRAGGGRLEAHAVGPEDRIATGLVFRSIGYRPEPTTGVPFDAAAGVVPNARGRVLDRTGGEPVRGQYVAGWLKRGPSGVIGTNKTCSQETVAALLEDAIAGRLPAPTASADDFGATLAARGVVIVDYRGWKGIDRAERRAGEAQGRPRAKLTRLDALLEAAG